MPQLNLVIPGLCGPLPEIDSLNSDSVKALVSWLARADQQRIPQTNFYEVLALMFGLNDTRPLPAAALSLLASGHYSEQGHWFRADPVYLQADMDHAILRDSHGLDLTLEESSALIEVLNAHFRQDGIRFLMTDKDSWFLNIADHERVTTTPLHEVIGRNVYTFMPQGEDALFWKKFMNEVQMLLHSSAVNEQREQADKLPVNGAWLWGGGALPLNAEADKNNQQSMEIFSRHAMVRGLSVLNGWQCHSVTHAEDFMAGFPATSNSLLVLDDLFEMTSYGDVMAWQSSLDKLYSQWLEPVLNWAMKKKIKVNLYPCNGVCYQISPYNKFRFFRNKRIRNYIHIYE